MEQLFIHRPPLHCGTTSLAVGLLVLAGLLLAGVAIRSLASRRA